MEAEYSATRLQEASSSKFTSFCISLGLVIIYANTNIRFSNVDANIGLNRKLAGFQRKYFWLQDEPISHKSLTSYLRGEKPEVGNHNAAWSSTTGKGLLYFSKTAAEKATPTGVINLVSPKYLIRNTCT